MSGKVAIVTGSNKGVGFATVRKLCSEFDGTVYLTSRDAERGAKAVEELTKEGLNPAFHQLDVTDQGSIDRLAAHIKEVYGGLDVLVNNAAVLFFPDCGLPLMEQAEKTLGTNYYALKNVCNALYPLLRPHARVVTVSSVAGHLQRVEAEELRKRFADPNLTEEGLEELVQEFNQALKDGIHEEKGWPKGSPIYGVSKVAASALTRIHHRRFLEDPREDIVINHVHPGFVDTDMVKHMGHLTIDQGATAPSYAALLPKNCTSPNGEFLWHDTQIVDWVNGPLPAKY